MKPLYSSNYKVKSHVLNIRAVVMICDFVNEVIWIFVMIVEVLLDVSLQQHHLLKVSIN
jgi:hypothetical protein